MKKLLLTILLMSISFTALANDLEKNIQRCSSDVAHSHACFTKLNKQYDAQLNKQYQRLLKVIPKAYKVSLIKTQNIWLKFRRADYQFTALESASMRQLLQDTSYARITAHRVQQFEEYLFIWDTSNSKKQ